MEPTTAPSLTRLRQVHLLTGLSDDVLEQVAQHCRCRIYRSGQDIVSRNANDRDLYLILSGRVRVTALSPGGREVSFRDLDAGNSFGELAAIDGGQRSATVQALSEAVLARIQAEDLHELMRLHWPICERILAALTRTVRDLSDRVYALSTQNVQERLAGELLRLCHQLTPSAGAVVLDPMPRHAELAGRIGSYREQVTRELADLERQGLVRRGDRMLAIPDLAQLQRFVERFQGRS